MEGMTRTSHLGTCMTFIQILLCQWNVGYGIMGSPQVLNAVQTSRLCSEQWDSDGTTTSGLTITTNCSRLGLSKIPQEMSAGTKVLYMSYNNISDIPDNAFQHLRELRKLDLSHNFLKRLTSNKFRSLLHLESLDLRFNFLCLQYNTFPLETFYGLLSLTDLNLSQQHCTSSNQTYPDQTLKDISSLESLSIVGLPHQVLGDGFGELKHLKHVEFSGEHCDMRNVSSDLFVSLKDLNITTLIVHSCGLDPSLPVTVLRPLRHLQTLSLACNSDLGVNHSLSVLSNTNSPQLETVILDEVHREQDYYEYIHRDRICNPVVQNLKRFSLQGNSIAYYDPRIHACLMKIPYVGFGSNPSLGELYPGGTGRENARRTLMSFGFTLGLETLDISYSNLGADHFKNTQCNVPSGKQYVQTAFRKPPDYVHIPENLNLTTFVAKEMDEYQMEIAASVPSSLKYVYYDHVSWQLAETATEIRFREGNNILYLNVSHCNLHVVERVYGLSMLQVLDVSHCQIREVHYDVCAELPRMRYAHLHHNQLGLGRHNISNCFHNWVSLEHLDLSYNKMMSLDGTHLSGMTSLRFLNLAGNKLMDPFIPVNVLKSLIHIDLSKNAFPSLKHRLTEQLSLAITERRINLDMSNNPFVCDCTRLPWLQWLRDEHDNIEIQNEANYNCLYNGSTTNLFALNMGEMHKYCSHDSGGTDIHKRNSKGEQMSDAFIPGVLVMICVGAATLWAVYNSRWNILLKYSSCKRKILALSEKVEPSIYAAYVVQNHQSDVQFAWTDEQLCPKVEKEWGLRLYLNFRDDEMGRSLASNITRSICQSEKVLVLVTPDFDDNELADFALQYSLGKKSPDNIILCILNQVPHGKMSKTMQALLKLDNVLVWSSHPDRRHIFWTTLQKKLCSRSCTLNS